jgi:dTDP-4-dehydrorhamnose reductase
VLICSGITDINFCQSHPVFSFNVNVIKTLELINYFISKKIFVIFLSTSSVFDGNIKFPNEKNVLNPSTIYGFQKSEVERLSSSILNANIFLAIVRITKVINFNREPFRTFICKLRNAEEIFPFSDLTFSPVSLNYVTSSLLKIAKNREAGIYHLTGSEDINYYDFLKKISKFMKLNTELVKQGNTIDIKNRPLFTPKYASLGLTNKNLKLMIKSQPIREVVKFSETT